MKEIGFFARLKLDKKYMPLLAEIVALKDSGRITEEECKKLIHDLQVEYYMKKFTLTKEEAEAGIDRHNAR